LCFQGDLDRARKQIEAINYNQMELDTSVQRYRRLVDAEQARRRLFSDGVSPKFLMDAPEHVRFRIEAVNRLRENRSAEAKEWVDKANAQSPPLQGQLNNKPFTSLRDCDDLLAGVLEVMSQDNYYWVPLEQVSGLAINPPRFPRDLLWIPAHLELKGGPDGDVFLPALYPDSHTHADNQVKLGRATDWKGGEADPVRGIGLHTFLVGEDALSLLEWRELVAEAG